MPTWWYHNRDEDRIESVVHHGFCGYPGPFASVCTLDVGHSQLHYDDGYDRAWSDAWQDER